MKIYLLFFTLFCISLFASAQERKAIYYLLEHGKDVKTDQTRVVTIKTARMDPAFSFSIPCNCEASVLGFAHIANPETGRVNLPIRQMTKQEFKRTHFVSKDSLIKVMRSNDDAFNRKFNLFLVEKGKPIMVYPVFKITSFGDYYH